MNQQTVSCKEVMNHICESLGEEINSPKCVAIKIHLENCSGCKNYFDSIEKTISFYKMYNVELSEKSRNKLLTILGLDEV